MSFALSILCVLSVNAQQKGDWYVGTGDIANTAGIVTGKHFSYYLF